MIMRRRNDLYSAGSPLQTSRAVRGMTGCCSGTARGSGASGHRLFAPLCHTAIVAFHEAFWIVTGTAAPVIALAAVVSAGEAYEQLDRMISAGTEASVAHSKVRDEPKDEEQVRKLAGLAEKRAKNLWLTGRVQQLNVGLQAALLAVSLISVGNQHNLVPPWVAVTFAVLGLLFVAVVGARVISARRIAPLVVQYAKLAADMVWLAREVDALRKDEESR